MQSKIRVRFAPSPTGKLHLGGLRTALFNYIFAKKTGGTFLFRLEDTDTSRTIPHGFDDLRETLIWAGIRYDEGPDKQGPYGPYIQSQRTHIYKRYMDHLLMSGHVYRCFCSPEKLEKERSQAILDQKPFIYDRSCYDLPKTVIESWLSQSRPYTLRLKMSEGKTRIQDKVFGEVIFDHQFIDDPILIKSDGSPTYHCANVIDDHCMKITHVLRGEEWLPSTPKHLQFYKAMDWEPPNFAHLPLLLNTDRSKLSKRQGSLSVKQLEKEGILPAALINFVALLGWNPGTTKELFTIDELIEEFSLERVHKAGSIVDRDRLLWFNQQHLQMKLGTNQGNLDVIKLCRSLLSEDDMKVEKIYLTDTYLSDVLLLAKNRLNKLSDLATEYRYFFKEPEIVPPLSSSEVEILATWIKEVILTVSWDLATLENLSARICEHLGIDQKQGFLVLRKVLTGVERGPSILKVMKLLGKERALQRFRSCK